jgi:hypothetical protein
MVWIKRSTICFGILLMTLMVSACIPTQVTSVWKDPAYQRQPQKIMVIGVALTPAIKKIVEDEFVRQFKSRGVDAVASYTLLLAEQLNDHDAVIAAKLKNQGADAVLISRFVSQRNEQYFAPEDIEYPPPYYANCWDYYEMCAQSIYSPSYKAEDEYAVMETNLYDAGNDKLIWAVASETVMLGSDLEQIKSYIRVIVKSMVEKKLLK